MKKIVVGMSGGVDSTVAAYLLKQKGYDIIGATMIVDHSLKSIKKDINDAKIICEKWGIKHIVKDVSDRFKNIIIDRFVKDYTNGFTPPPCSICNGKIKFRFLYDLMVEENCDFIATGHYAKIKDFAVVKSDNKNKDQSYMLYSLDEDELSHLILPIESMDKSEVREIAKNLGLDVSEKKDSEDLCFIKEIEEEIGISDKPYVEYIKRYFLGNDYREKILRGELTREKIEDICPFLRKGEFVDKYGKVLGYHDGIINFTIGQRKGLNIAFGDRKYVIDIDAKNNKILLGDNEDLYKNSIYIKYDDIDTVFQGLKKDDLIDLSQNKKSLDTYVKVRYRDIYNPCEIRLENQYINIKVKNKIRAITPGQVAVVYDNMGKILFGGIIQNVV